MTLSFSKLNEIAHLYENAVHGEQEVLGEDASDAGLKTRKAIDFVKNNVVKGVKAAVDVTGAQYQGLGGQKTTSKDPIARAANSVTRTISDPYRKAAPEIANFTKSLVTGQRSDKPAAKPPTSSTNTPSRFSRPQNAAPGLSDIRGGQGNAAPSKYKSSSDGKMYKNYNDALAARNSRQKAGAGTTPPAAGTTPPAGAGARPPGGNSPKLLPAKPAAPAKPAIPTGTTAGGTTFQRRAATGDELRAAQDARAAAKAAGNTKGAEEAAVKAGVNASKPATPSLSQRAAAMPAMGSSQFKPATASQATNAAGSNSAAASGSLVPASNKIASSLKPIDLKASYEYDVYDLVLEYLLDNGHVDTVEEANYVMMEMDAETIGNIVEARMDPRGRPASGPMNVYRDPKGKPDQAHLDAIKSYDEKQKKKTPAQRQAELDAYIARQRNK